MCRSGVYVVIQLLATFNMVVNILYTLFIEIRYFLISVPISIKILSIRIILRRLILTSHFYFFISPVICNLRSSFVQTTLFSVASMAIPLYLTGVPQSSVLGLLFLFFLYAYQSI